MVFGLKNGFISQDDNFKNNTFSEKEKKQICLIQFELIQSIQ